MNRELSRPRVGLALGGGVARGLAHIGVLDVLERSGVPIDVIAGTSMGAIIGASYAAGMGISELKLLASRTGWLDVSGVRPGRNGLVSFKKMERWVEQMVGDYDIRDLALPFAAVASDLSASRRVILSRGRLATALRASAAVPGFAEPVEWEGRQLVDGGITDNVPGDVARLLGADYVVGVDVFMPALRRHFGPFKQGLAAIETLVRHAGQGLNECDIMIVPELRGKSYFRFNQYPELITLGEEAARAAIPQIMADLTRLQAQPPAQPRLTLPTTEGEIQLTW